MAVFCTKMTLSNKQRLAMQVRPSGPEPLIPLRQDTAGTIGSNNVQP